MSYKTVLVHLDESPRLGERVRLAAQIAMLDDGHLIGVALTGVSRFLYPNEMVDEQDPHLALHLNFLRERAERALAGFAAQLDRLGLRSFEQRVVDDEAGTGLSLHGRYADLVVIGQSEPQRGTVLLGDLPGHVLMHSGRPLLIVPRGEGGSTLRRVLVGWDASKEAARAVNAALPLLQAAEHVDVAVFDPEQNLALHGDTPGAELALYLARHGVTAQVVVRQAPRQLLLKRSDDIGEALLALAAERGCDLLVLGAYGHSRFRETLLGGVTRTVLANMSLPVLMAH